MTTAIVQAVAQELVNAAAEHIRQLDRKHNLVFALQMGSYLVGTFFGGNAAEARSRDPGKQASLRMLADHPVLIELGVSQSTLANFIGIYLQLEALPSDKRAIIEALTLSKQIALLSVPDADEKLRFAHGARGPDTTVRKLKATIQLRREKTRERAGKGKPGPKAKEATATTRFLRVAERALADAADGAGFAQEIAEALALVRKVLAATEAPPAGASAAGKGDLGEQTEGDFGE